MIAAFSGHPRSEALRHAPLASAPQRARALLLRGAPPRPGPARQRTHPVEVLPQLGLLQLPIRILVDTLQADGRRPTRARNVSRISAAQFQRPLTRDETTRSRQR